MPIAITAKQIRAARALTGLGQQELADRACVGVATIRRIEAAADEITGSARSMARIEHALAAAGVIFIDQDETAGPGVRLRRPSR